MNKFLILSLLMSAAPVAAFAADLAVETPAPVVASASDYSGYVEASVSLAHSNWDYNYYDYYYSSWDNDIDGFSAAGALAYKLNANWQVQADASYDNFHYKNGGSSYGVGYAALHANYYDGDYAIGAFGGVASFSYDQLGFGGVEGQVAVAGNLVFTGQLGYIGGFAGSYADNDSSLYATFGQVGVKYFLADNLEVGASVGGAAGDFYYDDGDFSLWAANIEAAYQLDDSPVSLFASYSYSEADREFYDINVSTLRVGARFAFDGESLKSQALTGASHKVFDFSTFAKIW